MVHIKPSHTTTLAQCCMDIALLPICSPQYSLGRAIHVRRNSHMLSEAKGSCTHRVQYFKKSRSVPHSLASGHKKAFYSQDFQ